MRELLALRTPSGGHISLLQRALRAALFLALGVALGYTAKYLDNVPIVGEIGTRLGVWILIATLIAIASRTPIAAAIHVLLFFAGMLSAYYTYSMVLFGFFPKHYFLAWGSIALLSPIGAYFTWYALGQGFVASFIASLPLAFLLAEGYPFFYTRSIPLGFSLLAAVGLFMPLTHDSQRKRWQVLLFTAVMFYLVKEMNILSRLFGGL